jgi:hypothetical protein
MSNTKKCIRCSSKMSLERYCTHEDGVVLRVYRCMDCLYIHVETTKFDEPPAQDDAHYVI